MTRLAVVDLDQLEELLGLLMQSPRRYGKSRVEDFARTIAPVERGDVWPDDHPQSVTGYDWESSDDGEFYRRVEA